MVLRLPPVPDPSSPWVDRFRWALLTVRQVAQAICTVLTLDRPLERAYALKLAAALFCVLLRGGGEEAEEPRGEVETLGTKEGEEAAPGGTR